MNEKRNALIRCSLEGAISGVGFYFTLDALWREKYFFAAVLLCGGFVALLYAFISYQEYLFHKETENEK